jgi:hypothetical protein
VFGKKTLLLQKEIVCYEIFVKIKYCSDYKHVVFFANAQVNTNDTTLNLKPLTLDPTPYCLFPLTNPPKYKQKYEQKIPIDYAGAAVRRVHGFLPVTAVESER